MQKGPSPGLRVRAARAVHTVPVMPVPVHGPHSPRQEALTRTQTTASHAMRAASLQANRGRHPRHPCASLHTCILVMSWRPGILAEVLKALAQLQKQKQEHRQDGSCAMHSSADSGLAPDSHYGPKATSESCSRQGSAYVPVLPVHGPQTQGKRPSPLQPMPCELRACK